MDDLYFITVGNRMFAIIDMVSKWAFRSVDGKYEGEIYKDVAEGISDVGLLLRVLHS